MDKAQDILKKVRRIELRARKLATETFAGEYRSGFRGQGLDFDDFREYLAGDDPRFIDWKVTARMNTPFVRKFRESREQALILAVDASGSMRYASQGHDDSKLEYAAHIAAVLAYSAAKNGDKCGLLIYGQTTHFYLPPAKGMKQTLRIIREILSTRADEKDDSLNDVADEILSTQRKSAMVVLISDFWAPTDRKALGKLSFKHELIPIRIVDDRELRLPDTGRVIFRDPENGDFMNVNLENSSLRETHAQLTAQHREEWARDFKKLGLDYLDLQTGDDYMVPLRALFSRRSRQFAH